MLDDYEIFQVSKFVFPKNTNHEGVRSSLIYSSRWIYHFCTLVVMALNLGTIQPPLVDVGQTIQLLKTIFSSRITLHLTNLTYGIGYGSYQQFYQFLLFLEN